MTSLQKKVDEQVQCPICTDRLRDPRILPCLHTFCLDCLRAVPLKRQGIVACPYCRREHSLPPKGVDELPVNFMANSLLDALSIRDEQKEIHCDECVEPEAAHAQCRTCLKFLCELHSNGHKKAKSTAGHTIATMHELRSSASPLPIHRAAVCQAHDKQLKLFCETCERPICKDCTLIEHREHKYLFIKEAAANHKGAIAEAVAATRKHFDRIEAGVRDVAGMLDKVKARHVDVHSAIDKECDGIVAMVNQRRLALKSDVDEVVKSKTKALEHQLAGLQTVLAEVTSSCEFADRALANGSDVQLLGMKASLLRRLKELSNESPQLEPDVADDFSASFQTVDLRGAVAGMGAVRPGREIKRAPAPAAGVGNVVAVGKHKWSPDSCGHNVALSDGNRKATKAGGVSGTWNGTAMGTVANPASYKVRVRYGGAPYDSCVMIGLSSKRAFKVDGQLHDAGGWYLFLYDGKIYFKSSTPHKSYFDRQIPSGSVVEVRYDRAARQISFAVDTVCWGVAFTDVNPEVQDLYAAVNFFNQGESAEFVE